MELEIRNYLNSQSVKYAENDSQFIVNCPTCHKEGHVYLGKDNGFWDCKVCGAKGNFASFQKKAQVTTENVKANLSSSLVERQKAQLVGTSQYSYLVTTRKISPEIVQEYDLGLNDRGDITLPHYDENGKLLNIKCRYMGTEDRSKYYYVQSGGQVALYNSQVLKAEISQLLVCEGEFDVLAARTFGIQNVIGVPGCTYRKDNWIEKLSKVKEIFICFDMDEAGQKGAYDIATRLGLDRCKKVILPFNDVNECLQKGVTSGEIEKLILEAKQFPVPGISKTETFSDLVLQEVFEPNKLKGFQTGYKGLDALTKGFAEQELRVVSGLTSTGKTTWIMHEMLIYAKQNIPVAIFSLESPVRKIIKDMIQGLSSKPVGELPKEGVLELLEQLQALPIHWFDSRSFDQTLYMSKFKTLVKQVRDRYGVKFVVLDDLQFLVNSGNRESSTADKITEIMTGFKELANSLNIHLIVIAHVNRNNEGHMPKLSELKGSSGIEQLADYVMFLHRETSPDADEEIKSMVKIAISKNRLTGDTGIVTFRYHKDLCKYEEI